MVTAEVSRGTPKGYGVPPTGVAFLRDSGGASDANGGGIRPDFRVVAAGHARLWGFVPLRSNCPRRL